MNRGDVIRATRAVAVYSYPDTYPEVRLKKGATILVIAIQRGAEEGDLIGFIAGGDRVRIPRTRLRNNFKLDKSGDSSLKRGGRARGRGRRAARDRNYRNSPTPVPFHALCTGLVASMHAEIVALHGLLLDAGDSLGISPEQTEKAIAFRVQEQSQD